MSERAPKGEQRVHEQIGAALEPLCAALARIAPAKVGELRAFAASPACRRRVFIAANPLARGAYRAYLLGRYGEWRGAPWRG